MSDPLREIPEGYTLLPKGVRCRCVNLRGNDEGWWCCHATLKFESIQSTLPSYPEPKAPDVKAQTEVESFLRLWEPNDQNKLCNCAGKRVCVFHAASSLIRAMDERIKGLTKLLADSNATHKAVTQALRLQFDQIAEVIEKEFHKRFEESQKSYKVK